MNLMQLNPGIDVPHDIHVVIEIPSNADPIKYEVDDTGILFVDRFIGTAMRYPCNYGFVPQSLSEDGDPLDVLVITPFPVHPGCVIRCRPVGLLNMTDESGLDYKIVAVPHSKLGSLYDHVQEVEDLPQLLLAQIMHFFKHYKDLEPNKWVRCEGWSHATEAKATILASIERYKATESQKD
ncbi:MAG: inorganic diphosphatase [Pseudomonadota bacterium]